LIDETTAKQLDIISGSSTAGSAAETGKGILRRLVMPLVERAGYLNSIYSQLLKKLFLHYGQLAAKINLIDDRSRRANASNETRIAALEEELKRLRQQHNDKI
jgi:hypothetical protein